MDFATGSSAFDQLASSATSLAAAIMGLYSVFLLGLGRTREAGNFVAGSIALAFLPTIINQVAGTAASSAPSVGPVSTVIGSWYGNESTADLVTSCMTKGAQLSDRIWTTAIKYGLPQIGLAIIGIRAYLASASGNHKPIIAFVIMGSILVPLALGGASAPLPRFVLSQSASLVSELIDKNSNTKIEKAGIGGSELNIARTSAHLPKKLRDQIIAYNIATAKALADAPANQRTAFLSPTASDILTGQVLTTTPFDAWMLDGSPVGPDHYQMPKGMREFAAETIASNTMIWTDPISSHHLWKRLSNGKGYLRDRDELGYQLTVWPLVGYADPTKLKKSIDSLYSYYNARALGRTKEAARQLVMQDGSETGLTSDQLTAIENDINNKISANFVAVNPPDVIVSQRLESYDSQLRSAITKHYTDEASRFAKEMRATAGQAPLWLYQPDFWGVMVFARKSIQLPKLAPEVERALSGDPWEVYISSAGIQADLDRGFSGGHEAEGAALSTSSMGFFGLLKALLVEPVAWVGFIIISNLLVWIVPVVLVLLPWCVGLVWFFVLACYPIFACAACWPGRWTALLDWSKAVLWVMSWAVCWQIGVSWIQSPMATYPSAYAIDGSAVLENQYWTVAGLILIVAAPAITSVILNASSSAISNLSTMVFGVGGKIYGASLVTGATAIAAAGAAPFAAASAASASSGGVTTGAGMATGGTSASHASGASQIVATKGIGPSAGGSPPILTPGGTGGPVRFGAEGLGPRIGQTLAKGLEKADALLPSPTGGSSMGLGTGGRTATLGRASRAGAISQSSGSPSPGPVHAQKPAAQGIEIEPDKADKNAISAPSMQAYRAAERAHAAAAAQSDGVDATAHHSSMAAAAAVAGRSPSAPKRIETAIQDAGAAIAGAASPEDSGAAHTSAARAQLARAEHLAGKDPRGAALAREAAASHLEGAAAGIGAALTAATARGDDQAQRVHAGALAEIAAESAALAPSVSPRAAVMLAKIQSQGADAAPASAGQESASINVAVKQENNGAQHSPLRPYPPLS